MTFDLIYIDILYYCVLYICQQVLVAEKNARVEKRTEKKALGVNRAHVNRIVILISVGKEQRKETLKNVGRVQEIGIISANPAAKNIRVKKVE